MRRKPLPVQPEQVATACSASARRYGGAHTLLPPSKTRSYDLAEWRSHRGEPLAFMQDVGVRIDGLVPCGTRKADRFSRALAGRRRRLFPQKVCRSATKHATPARHNNE